MIKYESLNHYSEWNMPPTKPHVIWFYYMEKSKIGKFRDRKWMVDAERWDRSDGNIHMGVNYMLF